MKQSEILASQLNAEDPTSSNSTLVNRIQWENSPLTICSIEEGNKWFLALGTKRLTEYYEYQHEIETLLNNKTWDLIILITIAVTEDTLNYIEAEKQKNYEKVVNEIYNKDPKMQEPLAFDNRLHDIKQQHTNKNNL